MKNREIHCVLPSSRLPIKFIINPNVSNVICSIHVTEIGEYRVKNSRRSEHEENQHECGHRHDTVAHSASIAGVVASTAAVAATEEALQPRGYDKHHTDRYQ